MKKCSLCRQQKDDHFVKYGKYPNGSQRWAHSSCNSQYRQSTISDGKAQKRYAKHKRHRTAVYRIVYEAKQEGLISEPDQCEYCKEKKSLQAHHPDHSKPLDVIWLCQKCHGRFHSQEEGGETVIQVFTKRGACIGEYNTYTAAEKDLNLKQGTISRYFNENKLNSRYFFERCRKYTE